MKEIISVNMSKFLAIKDVNINILLNVILLAVDQVKKFDKSKINIWDLPDDLVFSNRERRTCEGEIALHWIN